MPNRGHSTTLTGAWRDRTGFCGVDPLDQPAGSLDLGQREHLRVVAERIRLTHDLLAGFADRSSRVGRKARIRTSPSPPEQGLRLWIRAAFTAIS